MRSGSVRTLLLSLAVMLVVSACGGGDQAAGPSEGQEQEASQPSGADTRPGAGARALTDADCRQYVNAFAGATPHLSDPSAPSFADIADAFEHASGRVPREIAGDFEVLAEIFRAVADEMGDLDVNLADPSSMMALTPQEMERLQAAMSNLDTPRAEEAGTNIDRFLTENCT